MLDYTQFPRQSILCIDSKSFFASVECAERGYHPMTKELVVMSRGNSQGGLVLAASPAVKAKYGIKTGSRRFQFPHYHNIEIVPPQMGLYIKRNRQINAIFKRYVAETDIHTYSIDESFLDVSYSHTLFGSNYQIAGKIQNEIWKTYRIPTSVGIGDNMLLAKLALDNDAKYTSPYIAYWSYENVAETVWKIDKLSDFWGIGSKMEKRLNHIGIYSIYDLAHTSIEKLKKYFGVIGEELYYHANGVDLSQLQNKYQPKSNSLSLNQVLPRNYHLQREVEIVLLEMVDQLSTRLRKQQQVTGQISLSVSHGEEALFQNFSHQLKIHETDQRRVLKNLFIQLFRKYYQGGPVRVIGVAVGKLSPKQGMQLNLFEDPHEIENREQLDLIIDSIRDNYGYESLIYANSLQRGSTAIERSKLIGGHHA
ncbi:Y-family DNA polymerase [Fundicoccus sp. Sow4_H7]|uniref:Y-family DNA polymerase n=1 Tax=Fundicoccus sp. Sow4_H7 TaxID=3438784 RepID=UPI003F92DF7A